MFHVNSICVEGVTHLYQGAGVHMGHLFNTVVFSTLCLMAGPVSKANDRLEESRPESESSKRHAADNSSRFAFHLSNGSVVMGKLETAEIEIETRFGKLIVPINKINHLKPGVDSKPDLKQQILDYIQSLDSDDLLTRNEASKALRNLEPGYHKVINRLAKSTANPGRTAQARALLNKISEDADADQGSDQTRKVASLMDDLETTEFTISGSIKNQTFAVTTKFGRFTIPVSKVLHVKRIRQGLVVPGNVALASRGAKVSGVDNGSDALIDGKTTGYTDRQGIAYGKIPSQWVIELPKVFEIQELRVLLWDGDNRHYKYKLEISVDGVTYQSVADRAKKQCKSWQLIRFDATPAKYIRLTGLHNSANMDFHVVEIEAYCVSKRWRAR